MIILNPRSYFSFEQEILTPHSASDLPRVIIGSRTYNQVSAQLKKLRETAGSASSSDAERDLKAREVAAQLKLLRAQTENAADDAEGTCSFSLILNHCYVLQLILNYCYVLQ